jgi:xylulokinase
VGCKKAEEKQAVAMLIGIDVGTTTVKAALFDLGGVAHKTHAARYPTSRPQAGHVEQNASDWTERVEAALSELGEGQSVAAIGLCSQVNTHVFVDDAGRALMPALTWQDGRCAEEAAELDAGVSVDEKLKWWGAPLPIDSSHVLSRIAHVHKHHPDIWQKTRWVMAPKDFCIQHLTGAVVADPMTNFGIVDQDLRLISPLIDLVPGAARRLPPLAGFTHVAGHVRAGLPCAGVPVVTGAMDAWSGLFGAGVSRDGDGLYLSGTSEILGIVSDRKIPTPGVIVFPRCEGITLHAGPTQSGGAAVEWLCRVLGKTASEISALAATAELKAVPLFLPHLEGERAPLWDVHSRGAFSGMLSSTGAAELARAVLEGVGYSARLVFDSLEQSASIRPEVVYHSGGGAASDVWCQIRADILRRLIKRTASRDAGVLGAALMAGVGCGVLPGLSAAAKSFVQFDREFEPDVSAAARHDERFEKYKLLYAQLKPVDL